jgi:hypothetical protein
MAIVQISRITQRKGLQEDLPQLAGAEFGWSVDSRRLYIGNGTLEEGAPVVGNTEILTEFSDILVLSQSYTYKGQAAGYTVQTGPTSGDPITLNLQQWMDQWASVLDFGATGDGVTDDTSAINRALNQLYCRESNPQIRRGLFFPAGVYKVSQSIVIPPYATLYGEGIDNSVIDFRIDVWTNEVAYSSDTVVVVEGVDSTRTYYISLGVVPIGIDILDTDYWALTTLDDYVIRTGDSLQQTGLNIGANGATTPQFVSLFQMGFRNSDNENLASIALVEDATDCRFENVKFEGPLVSSGPDLRNADIGTKALDFASTPSLVTQKINIKNCILRGTTWGVYTDQQLASIDVSFCTLDNMFQGIVLGDLVPVNGGATGFRISNCAFDTIYNQGIVFGDVSLNSSCQNIFYNVGNQFQADNSAPLSEVVRIKNANNISVSDMFERLPEYSVAYPRILLADNDLAVVASIAVTNAEKIQLGSFTRETGQRATLLDNRSSATSLFSVDCSTVKAFNVNYTIIRDTAYRTGTLTVVSSSVDSTGDLEYSDDFVENSSTGIVLSLTESSDDVNLLYTSTSTGSNAVITYSVTHLG